MNLKSNSQNQLFDGIVCFGGVDWWYHNRGHYDIQMMRHLRTAYPILYVNSIGMRPQSKKEGRMYYKRLLRKSVVQAAQNGSAAREAEWMAVYRVLCAPWSEAPVSGGRRAASCLRTMSHKWEHSRGAAAECRAFRCAPTSAREEYE